MQLYFRPFACSLASRIALIESGHDADFHHVDGDTLADGSSYAGSVNRLGYVPALHIGEEAVLTENTAILQYIADLAPASGLLPPVGDPQRYRVLQWLGFVSTELHHRLFGAIFSAVTEEQKALIRDKGKSRLDHLAQHLEGRNFLVGERFTIADAYLVAVLNWCEYTGVDIKAWPVLNAYRTRLRARPSVVQAFADERPLLKVA
jgi:glutathione S-transferase